MRRASTTWILLVSAACQAPPAPAVDVEQERAAIEATFDSMAEAWRAGDGQAWGAHFADDADFTVWFGMRLAGREEISFGHQIIFDGIYAGTVFRMEVTGLSFPTDDIAIALLDGRVIRDGVVPDRPHASPLAVLQRTSEGRWEIIAFQNTPYAVEELRANGDIARFQEVARTVAAGG